jgi:hypothetical protein
MDRFIEIVRNVGCHPVSRRIRRILLRNCCEQAYRSSPRMSMSMVFPNLSTLRAGHQVPPEISPGDLARALLVCLTSQIGCPNFRRMRGADGATQSGRRAVRELKRVLSR